MRTLPFRNPRLVALTLLVIIAAGLSAFLSLGRQEDPTITNLNATITTLYPGAEPSRIEALISQPLEDEMRTLADMDEIKSTSATGISIISLQLDEATDPAIIEEIWSKARDGVADVARTFPEGVRPPEFDSEGIAAVGAIFAVKPSGAAANPAVLARTAEELAERLRNVPGTKSVESWGTPTEEVRVTLDPAAIAALGLTPDAVSAAVRAADAKVQSGRLVSGSTDILLDVQGDIEALDRLRQIVLATGPQGQVTRLGDVAEISRSPRDPAPAIALVDGQEAILLGVQANEGLQIDVWMGWIRDEVAAFAPLLPASLTVEQIFDQAVYTADRLSEVALNMAIGVGLVVLVLLVTLGVRAALIVAAVLPLVSLATLASMNFIGLPIHQMSVTGLIVALGLLVDAAIVMTDDIRQRLRAGASRMDAVDTAVKRLFAPLLASTVTTALSFVPMILLPGGAGDFVGAIAIAVVLMLIWSLIIALTITPALAGWLLPEGGRGAGLPSGLAGRAFHASLRWSVRNPVRSVALALVLPAMGFASFPTLTAQFFPGVDRDQFHIEVDLAPGAALSRTHALVEEMDALLRDTPGITRVAWTLGESAPAFYYNIVGSRQGAPGFAQALITTAAPEATADLLDPLQTSLTAAFPEARILVRGLIQGPPVDAPVEFRLEGPTLEVLRAEGERLRAILLGVEGITTVRASYEGGAPKVQVEIDEAAAQLAGLSLADVARQLQSGLDGVTGGSLIEASEQLPVRVQLGAGTRDDLERISQMLIVPPPGNGRSSRTLPAFPLSAIAKIALVPSDSPIARQDGTRVNTVQAFIAPDLLPQEALVRAQVAIDAAGFALPAGYQMAVGGDADARNDTVNRLLAPLGLIVTLSLATIVLTFGSFRLAAVTLVVAGLSAGLSLLSLAVFQYPFGITAIIGVIGSIGVSINAAIIILTGLQQDRAAAAGDRDAMAQVVMDGSRHILSTTLTTFGGFLPLILAGGGFWPPFAMAVAGGVLLSTVVSFYFTPPLFALLRPRRPETEGRATTRPGHAELKIAAE
ncbi:efflux RND transporter permease subunit [Dinoroseobacter sp. PD6]|uniref:efflux RND transporter permease subunit n=1 Tax=Dinoroseobacter sp. PD6 TaxID=3028384 RepID=UPI00237A6B33|nr:efflux RND transporter permease subunit [Dinoroseobacter sp. PD6]MDD9718957.1 efflux RND transporter permease subunit [Dinoroseobacter sp. PD6]